MTPDVVTAVAYQQRLATHIGLLGEEGIVVAVLTVEHLAGLQLERAVFLGAGITARHLDVHVLIVQHLAIGTDIRDVHRAVPVAGVVSGLTAGIAGYRSVGAVTVAVETNLWVGEEFLVANDRDDGQRVAVGGLDIGTGHRHAGQVAVAEEAEGVVRGVADGELAVLALLRGFYGLTVSGIELPTDVIEIEVVVLLVAVQVEGDGLHLAF